MTIDKALCVKVAAEIDAAVKAVLEANGLESTGRKAEYGDRFVYRLTATAVSIDEATGVNVESPEAQAYLKYGTVWGIPEGVLGGKYRKPSGETYTFLGLLTSSRKYPVLLRRDSDGKQFKFASAIASQITPP